MKLKLSDKQIKRIAKRIEAFSPPEHTDEELGAGDYAGEGNHEDTDIQDSRQYYSEYVEGFFNRILDKIYEDVNPENIQVVLELLQERIQKDLEVE